MTMRLKLYTLLCASFLFLFTSCNQDDDPVPPEAGSKTVLVYIVADKLRFFGHSGCGGNVGGHEVS